MELIVFDLDGTLLNRDSVISPYTRETLTLLNRRGIAYTVATGRTLHASRELLAGHGFELPHIYKNGVMIWTPQQDDFSHTRFLTQQEIQHVIEAVLAQGVAPFLLTLEPGNHHAIYHPPTLNEAEQKLALAFASREAVDVLPYAELPALADITNISALGVPEAIGAIEAMIADEPGLVAYTGSALEGGSLHWIDIHHADASKGGAVEILKRELGLERVLCFGDSDNDMSMFALADESYAPANAKPEIKAAATAVIGHHHEDGIAHFLRERFSL